MLRQANHDRKKLLILSEGERKKLHAAVFNDDLRKWLQSKGAAHGRRRRIERLIEACVSFAQLAPQASLDLLFDKSVDKNGPAYLKNRGIVDECHQLADTINRLLSRYKAIQTVEFDDGIVLEWVSNSPMHSDADVEFEIVRQIMNSLENGDLAKLRKCECGRYFFARSSIVRFCSEKCRTAYWESSETRKEQKRKKAKDYYRLHRTKNIK